MNQRSTISDPIQNEIHTCNEFVNRWGLFIIRINNTNVKNFNYEWFPTMHANVRRYVHVAAASRWRAFLHSWCDVGL